MANSFPQNEIWAIYNTDKSGKIIRGPNGVDDLDGSFYPVTATLTGPMAVAKPRLAHIFEAGRPIVEATVFDMQGNHHALVKEGDIYYTFIKGIEGIKKFAVARYAIRAYLLWSEGSDGLVFFDAKQSNVQDKLQNNLLFGRSVQLTPILIFDSGYWKRVGGNRLPYKTFVSFEELPENLGAVDLTNLDDYKKIEKRFELENVEYFIYRRVE